MQQYAIILKHLKKHSYITKVQGLMRYGILNTGDCILKLRNKGHKIRTVMVERKSGSAYARYQLEV